MGPGFGANMDFGPLFWFAAIGLFASVAVALGCVGWLIWFIINHVAIV